MVTGRTLMTSGAVHDSASSDRLLSYCICLFYFLGRLLPGPGVDITDATHGNQYKSTSFKSRSVYTHTCTLKHARNKKMIDISNPQAIDLLTMHVCVRTLTFNHSHKILHVNLCVCVCVLCVCLTHTHTHTHTLTHKHTLTHTHTHTHIHA